MCRPLVPGLHVYSDTQDDQLTPALVEVTPKPHNGCRKFKQRFGQDALEFVNRPSTRDQNLRGIYWKVVEAGEVSVGAAIQVVSPEQ